MLTRTVGLSLLTGVLVWGCSPEVEPLDSTISADERIERIVGALTPALVIEGDPIETQTLAERMQHHEVPGVSVAVVHGGEIEWARGWGLANVENQTPVTPDTIF